MKSANDAQGAAQTKMQSQPQTPIDDTSGADMSSVGQTLEAWSQGPSSVAAMTSGAQDKRPMQLSVVDVATHFAPVEMVADAPSKDQQVAADNKGVKLEAQAQPSIGIAVTDKQAQGGQAGGGAFDRGTQDKTPEPQIVPEARVDASSDIETLDIQPLTGQHASPARQVAQEVAREIPAMKHTAELYQDVKAPLSKLQVLKIQLQPENLGSVNVRIQLRADAIELHIDTSRAETAELLKRDRETLSTIMRAAGYAADDAQIKITHGDATMSAAMISAMDPSSSNSPTSQNSQNGGQSFAQSGTNERSAGSQDREGGQRQSGHDRADQHSGRERDGRPGPAAGQGSGIYL